MQAKWDNTKKGSSRATFNFISYKEEKMSVLTMFLMLFGGTVGFLFLLFILTRYTNLINLESFIYYKNKKIIPFFKPVVFGPLRIKVDDEKVKKAEFYVNGQLKDTVTKSPFIWTWNEPVFFKQKIETRVYDENGKTSSSGEMTFFVFNSPKIFK